MAQLRQTLEELGGLFAAFGHYLASRPDLLTLRDRIELAQITDRAPISPANAVCSVIAQERAASQELQHLLEARPCRRSLYFQWHCAHLDDDLVLVKVVRPQLSASVATDEALLALLEQLPHRVDGMADIDMAQTIGVFRTTVARALNLETEAQELRQLRHEAQGFEAFEVPELYPQWCSPRALACRLPTDTLLHPLAETPESVELQHTDLARRLGALWLQQSLLEPTLIEGPLRQHAWVRAGGRLLLTGGLLPQTSVTARRHLLQYLVAVARHEPGHACSFLLQESKQLSGASSRADLDASFRQAEPFRDGGWSDHFAGQRLADEVFVHLRLAHAHGYRPGPSLLSFARGLHDLELMLRQLAPEHDALADGVDDLRLVAGAAHIGHTLGVSTFKNTLTNSLPALQELYYQLDNLTGRDTSGSTHAADGQPRSATSGSDRSAWVVCLALVALLPTIVVATHRLAETQLAAPWAQGIGGTAFFVVCGVLAARLAALRKGKT